MNKPQTIPANDQSQQGEQTQKRAWVTPAFEQVALKDALNTPSAPLDNDGSEQSS